MDATSGESCGIIGRVDAQDGPQWYKQAGPPRLVPGHLFGVQGRIARPFWGLLGIWAVLCGALASGIVCIGLLYGRTTPQDDLTCVDEIAFELHRRFLEEFGEKECRALRLKYVPLSANHTCEYVYKRTTELAVQLLLDAPRLVAECPGHT